MKFPPIPNPKNHLYALQKKNFTTSGRLPPLKRFAQRNGSQLIGRATRQKTPPPGGIEVHIFVLKDGTKGLIWGPQDADAGSHHQDDILFFVGGSGIPQPKPAFAQWNPGRKGPTQG